MSAPPSGPSDRPRSERRRSRTVGDRGEAERGPPAWAFPTAALLSVVGFGWEILLQRHLVHTGGQLAASATLPAAVVGLGTGAAVAARLGPAALRVGAALLAPSFGLALAVILSLPDPLGPVALFGLSLPFSFVGMAVAALLDRFPDPRVYAADLGGAALATLLLVAALPLLLEERSAILLVAIAAAIPALIPELPARVRGAGLALALGLGFVGVTTRPNLGRDLPGLLAAPLGRVGVHAPRWIDSASSVVGRVDLYAGRWPQSFLLAQGVVIDTLREYPTEIYQLDPRVPSPFLPERPRIFIVGTAGEGILKTAVRLGGEVRGVESNPATLALVQRRQARRCLDCYAGVDVEVGDARAVLRRAGGGWDLVTWLNTHANQGWTGRAVAAEFLHTEEAIREAWRRLGPRGMLTWEEPELVTPRGALSRLVATIRAALLAEGVADPSAHLLVYRWGRYVQLLVRPTPWTEAEQDRWRAWLRELGAVETGVTGPLRSGALTEMRAIFPGNEDPDHAWLAAWLQSGLPPAVHPEELAPVRDDQPFLFSRPASRKELWLHIGTQLGLAVLPLALALGFAPRRAGGGASTLAAGALSGFVFLGVEALLTIQGQLAFGSPTLAFVEVLAGMLLASGLSALAGGRGAGPALALAALLALAGTGFSRVVESGHADRVALAWVLALGACLGTAFPRLLRRAAAEGRTPLFFALNAAGAAVAPPVVSLAALYLGFPALWLVFAAGAAGLALLLRR